MANQFVWFKTKSKRFEKMILHQNQVQVVPNFIKFSLDKSTEIFVQRFVNLGHFAR